jgi:hypothetical protein
MQGKGLPEALAVHLIRQAQADGMHYLMATMGVMQPVVLDA